MKRTFTFGNIFRFSLTMVLVVSFAAFFSSCKDREEDPYENVNVEFKVNASPDVKLKAIVTQVGTVQNTKFFNPSDSLAVTTWSSGPIIVNTKEGAVHLSSTAQGTSAGSELEVSIWINGEEKAIDTIKGINLVAKTAVDFNK